MIQFNCPHCDTELEAPDKSAGGKMACPDCGKKMLVPELEEAAPPKKAPAPASKKPAASLTSKKPGGAAVSRPAAKSQRRRDDDDDYDDRPSKKKQGSSKGLWIGLGVGGGVAALVVVLIVVLMTKGDKPDNTQANNTPVGTGVPQVGDTTKADAGKTTTTPPVEVKAGDPPAAVVGGAPASVQRIYKRLLKSTVLIISSAGMGSGGLIDKKNRVIVTNHHVVGGNRQVAVFFPVYKDGRMISELDYFMKQAKDRTDVLIGTVLISDEKIDAALVQLPSLPEGVEPIPIAPARPNVTDPVYNVGHPGASGGLWVFTDGKVRQFIHKTWRSSNDGIHFLDHDCDIILTTSSTNHGDSGGPLVNDRAQMVAIVQGGVRDANSLSTFVDAVEIRRLIDRYSQSNGMKFEISTEAGVEGGNTGDLAGLIQALENKEAKVRANAARSLGEMGPGAKSAVTYLMSALKDKDEFVKRMAMEALNLIGLPDKVDAPKLANALKDSSLEVRTYAAETLGRLGPDGKAALPALVAASKDPDANLRQVAVRALGRVGGENKEAVLPVLTEVFGDPDKDVRLASAEAMGNLALTAGDLAILVPMLKHKEIEGRIGSARAIGRIGPEARTAIKPLTEALANTSPLLRKAVLDTLATFNADAKESIPDIEKCLKGGDKEVRRSALLALGSIGVESKVAVPAIAECCKDFDLRKDAMATLAKIGPPAAKEGAVAVAIVLKATSKEDRRIALETLAVLKPTGAEAKDVVSRVIDLFNVEDKDKDKDLFDKAAETIGKIGKPALQQLAVALQHTNHNMRMGSAMCLGELGPDARSAVTTLIQYRDRDPNPDVRNACSKAITRIAR